MLRRVLIMGAAGRDFHNFNVVYRDDPETEVVAFTATQIPYIDDRTLPRGARGDALPDGIPIHEEDELVAADPSSCDVDDVVFAYSDVSHEYVMHQGERGARRRRELPAARTERHDAPARRSRRWRSRPCAPASASPRRPARSPATLKEAGKKVVAVRHPMPYGDLAAQRVQRFAELEDLDRHDCTIEEREEYEPHITSGTVIYAGVDYGGDPRAGAGRGRRPAVGRRQQRPPVLPARRAHRARRPAAGRPRDCGTTPARPTCARADVDRDQQDGFVDARAGRPARGDDRATRTRRRRS